MLNRILNNFTIPSDNNNAPENGVQTRSRRSSGGPLQDISNSIAAGRLPVARGQTKPMDAVVAKPESRRQSRTASTLVEAAAAAVEAVTGRPARSKASTDIAPPPPPVEAAPEPTNAPVEKKRRSSREHDAHASNVSTLKPATGIAAVQPVVPPPAPAPTAAAVAVTAAPRSRTSAELKNASKARRSNSPNAVAAASAAAGVANVEPPTQRQRLSDASESSATTALSSSTSSLPSKAHANRSASGTHDNGLVKPSSGFSKPGSGDSASKTTTTMSASTVTAASSTSETAVRASRMAAAASVRRSVFSFRKGGDPAQCLDIMDRMYDVYYQQETLYTPKLYMSSQMDINQKMRSILVDWLVEVHHKFKLQPLTLWLCVNILDRYLEISQTTMRSKLQLVGVTAFLIACKYEEIYPPEVRECVYITDYAYEREEILKMEFTILNTLNYNIFVPTGYHFLSRYLNAIQAPDRTRFLAMYYAERNLQEYDMLRNAPHKFAAAALYAALSQPASNPYANAKVRAMVTWNKSLQEMTGFMESDLVGVAQTIVQHVSEEPETASKRRLLAAKKKYANEKYLNVSALPLPRISVDISDGV